MARESTARAIELDSPVAGQRILSSAETSVHRSVGVIELNPEGQVIAIDRTVEVLAGLEGKGAFRLDNLVRLSQDDLLALTGARGESREYEIELTRQNGNRIPIAVKVLEKAAAPGRAANVKITIRSLVEERITTALRMRTRSSKTAHELFDVMADEVQKWVPFIHCGASIYNDDLIQARTVFSSGPVAIAWPNRYFDLSGAQRRWLREAKRGPIPDLEMFQRDPRWKAAIDPDTAHAMSALKSAYRIPVVRGNTVAGSVNFFRNRKDGFTDQFELDLLRTLAIDNIFLVALAYLDYEEVKFQMDLAKQLADRSTPEILDKASAEIIVNRLAQHYGWDAITICRVNRQQECFELQAIAGKKAEFIDPSFKQRLDEGVIGEAYQKNEVVCIRNIAESEKYQRLFLKKLQVQVQSELCIPIRAGKDIVALLNVEDSRRNAFARTEIETITDLFEKIESMMKEQRDSTIINASFDWAPSALFVLAPNGRIEKANSRAASMTGYKAEELIGKPLNQVLEPAEIATKLFHGSASREDMRLISKNSVRKKVVVASAPFGGLMGAVVTARDVLTQQRIEELEGLERIFSSIAAQTKVPLALAFSGLLNLKQSFENDASGRRSQIAEDLERICRNLRRAEITYDHLALYDKSAAGGLQPNPIIIEAGKLLDVLIGELPSFDAERLEVTGNAKASRILADVYQVSWALLSLLSYGLRLLPESGKLQVTITSRKRRGKAWVRFGVRTFIPLPSQPARRRSDIFIGQVISDLTLGRRSIEAFARANNGRFECPKKLLGDIELALSFPLTHIAG